MKDKGISKRYLVLTYDNIYSNIVLSGMIDANVNIIGVVMPKSLNFRTILKKCDWHFLYFKVREMLYYKQHMRNITSICREKNIPIFKIDNINKDIDCVQVSPRPDILVSINFPQIIRSSVLDNWTVINIHSGILPEYRGLFPYYWCLVNGEKRAGITVHYIDHSIDTGDIIAQAVIDIVPEDTVFTLNRKLHEIGARLMVHAIMLIETESVNKKVQGAGRYYSYPTAESYKSLVKKGVKLF